jgi:ABC-type sugar transport system ATPase subunit
MLRIEHLTKDLGEFMLRDVSLEVNEGEYLVIIGPTGAGKTILLETVAGIYPPDGGSIRLGETDITDLPSKDRNICMVYQDYMLFPHLTVGRNIGFGLRNRKVPPDEIARRIAEVAALFGIDHLLHRYPETLSGGEKQRAAIARALVLEPTVLLLDEPLSALDGQTREKLREELRRLHEVFRTTVIHITHNFEEVFSLADRVAVMKDGEILQTGEPDEIFRQPCNEFVAGFVGVENLFRGVCRQDGDLAAVEVEGRKIRSTARVRDGAVFVSVRPEDIILSAHPITTSAQNSFSGRITGIVHHGAVVKLTVDCGIPFCVAITRQGFDALGVGTGDPVRIAFKAAAAHIF